MIHFPAAGNPLHRASPTEMLPSITKAAEMSRMADSTFLCGTP
jgi:hypothetical protein